MVPPPKRLFLETLPLPPLPQTQKSILQKWPPQSLQAAPTKDELRLEKLQVHKDPQIFDSSLPQGKTAPLCDHLLQACQTPARLQKKMSYRLCPETSLQVRAQTYFLP